MTTFRNVFGYRINIVFKHRWEKSSIIDQMTLWRPGYKLGIWYKSYKVVGVPKTKDEAFGETTNKAHQFGMDGIVFRTWLDICYQPLVFGGHNKSFKKKP